MKKRIVALFLILFLLCSCSVKAIASVELSIEGSITGYVGATLDNDTLSLYLHSDGDILTFTNLSQGDDITSWFTNAPEGIKASFLDYIDDSSIYVQFENVDIKEEYNAQIAITIPSENLDGYSQSLSNIPNEYSIYDIDDLTPSAKYNGDYVVSGIVGETIVEQYVYIKTTNAAFENSINVGDTFMQDYNGLSITVKEVDYVNNIIKIAFNGIPLTEDHSNIISVIDDSFIVINQDLNVPEKDTVHYDINPKPIVEPQPIVEPEPIVEPQPIVEPEPIVEYINPNTGID